MMDWYCVCGMFIMASKFKCLPPSLFLLPASLPFCTFSSSSSPPFFPPSLSLRFIVTIVNQVVV